MTVEDLPVVAAMCQEYFDPGVPLRTLQSHMKLPNAAVMEQGGRICGFYLSCVSSDPKEWRFLAAGVVPQSEGLGKLLAHHVLQVAEQQGYNRLTCEVARGNVVAQRLYASVGGVVTGVRPNYYTRRDGTPEDALVMTVTL